VARKNEFINQRHSAFNTDHNTRAHTHRS